MNIILKRAKVKYPFVIKLVISIFLISFILFMFLFLSLNVTLTNKAIRKKYDYLNVYELDKKDIDNNELISEKFDIKTSNNYNIINAKINYHIEKEMFFGSVNFITFNNNKIPNYYYNYLKKDSYIGKEYVEEGEIVIPTLIANILLNDTHSNKISLNECEVLLNKHLTISSDKYSVNGEIYTDEKDLIKNKKIVGIFDSSVISNKIGAYALNNAIILNNMDYEYSTSSETTYLYFNSFDNQDLTKKYNEEYDGTYYGEYIQNQLQLLEKESNFTNDIFVIVGILLILSISFNLFIVIKSYIKEEIYFDNLLCSLGLSKSTIKRDRLVLLGTFICIVNFISIIISNVFSSYLINNIISEIIYIGENYIFKLATYFSLTILEIFMIYIFINTSYSSGKEEILFVNKNI